MRGVRDAIGQLPSWPGFALAALVGLGIGGWYYGSTYSRCVELRDGRELLRLAIERATDSATGELDLANTVPGTWDEVRIAQAHRPGGVPLNCPFGWDLTWRERQALIEKGQYTIIGFFKAGQFQRYIEYRGDWATFAEPPESISRGEARFVVAKPSASGGWYKLTLAR